MNKSEITSSTNESPEGFWQLKRQDDNGNQCVVATFDSEEAAVKAMASY